MVMWVTEGLGSRTEAHVIPAIFWVKELFCIAHDRAVISSCEIPVIIIKNWEELCPKKTDTDANPLVPTPALECAQIDNSVR